MLQIILKENPVAFKLGVDKKIDLVKISTYLRALAGKIKTNEVTVLSEGVQATGLATFTGAPAAAGTITVAGVAITARASGAVANEYNVGATIDETAANFAKAVNASVNLSGLVTAKSVLGVATLTSVSGGKVGNFLTLAKTATNMTVTAFANGSNGTVLSL